MDKPIFYERQEVGCLMYGEGIVRTIVNGKVRVELDKYVREYHINGMFSAAVGPTLYPIEQYRAIIANLPAPEPEKWQPKPGEWCWFWYDGTTIGVLDKFQCAESGRYFTSKVPWPNCAPFIGELPEHLKEVQS